MVGDVSFLVFNRAVVRSNSLNNITEDIPREGLSIRYKVCNAAPAKWSLV
jgi:hypothetical protein